MPARIGRSRARWLRRKRSSGFTSGRSRHEEARRDPRRGCVAPEGWTLLEGGQDREQRAHGPEHPAQDRGRVGRESVPCTIRLLKTTHYEAALHDFDEYERPVEAATVVDARAHLVVLLGGDAGLRGGEMMALEWPDIDLGKRQLRVQRSDWKGTVTAPKGGRTRVVPMTVRLATAMQAHRHLRGARVLCQEDGNPLTQKVVRDLVLRSARRALLRNQGVHVLKARVPLASCDARSPGTSYPGASRSQGPLDHAALHAPASGCG